MSNEDKTNPKMKPLKKPHPCDEACYPWADDEPELPRDFEAEENSGVWSADD